MMEKKEEIYSVHNELDVLVPQNPKKIRKRNQNQNQTTSELIYTSFFFFFTSPLVAVELKAQPAAQDAQ